jgi:hypothetical protein
MKFLLTFFGCGIRQVPTENDTSDLKTTSTTIKRKSNQNPFLTKNKQK